LLLDGILKCLKSLERVLQSKLDQPGIADRCVDNAEGAGRTPSQARVAKVRVVEDVEELRTEFEPLLFCQTDPFAQRCIPVHLPGAKENTNSRVPEGSGNSIIADDRRIAETSVVEVARSAARPTQPLGNAA
jgi:hypothetical protein